jgi:hypothetical protein
MDEVIEKGNGLIASALPFFVGSKSVIGFLW